MNEAITNKAPLIAEGRDLWRRKLNCSKRQFATRDDATLSDHLQQAVTDAA